MAKKPEKEVVIPDAIKALGNKNVKFLNEKSETLYGEAQDPTISYGSFYKDAVAAAAQGLVLIKDATTPQTYLVPPDRLTVIPFGKYIQCTTRNGFCPLRDDEFEKYQADEGNKALVASDKAGGKVVPEAMFRLPQGDGYAIYVITEVRGPQCLVEHRHFGGNDWYDHHFGFGGWFSKRSIAPYVAREYGLRQLFKPKSKVD